MAAILNFLLILMSGISGDCTIVCPTLENIGFGVGIASIWQSYKHFQFIPFVMAAILNFLLILISRISADCSIVFPTSKNLGVAVGIALLFPQLRFVNYLTEIGCVNNCVIIIISHFWPSYPYFHFFPVFQPPSWIFH